MDCLEPALLDKSKLVDVVQLGVHKSIVLVTIIRSLCSHLLCLLAVRNTLTKDKFALDVQQDQNGVRFDLSSRVTRCSTERFFTPIPGPSRPD